MQHPAHRLPPASAFPSVGLTRTNGPMHAHRRTQSVKPMHGKTSDLRDCLCTLLKTAHARTHTRHSQQSHTPTHRQTRAHGEHCIHMPHCCARKQFAHTHTRTPTHKHDAIDMRNKPLRRNKKRLGKGNEYGASKSTYLLKQPVGYYIATVACRCARIRKQLTTAKWRLPASAHGKHACLRF